MKKKLTHTGGVPMVFTVIAFVFSIIGIAALPVINAMRESKFDSVYRSIDEFEDSYKNFAYYIYLNFEAVGVFLLCLIALILLGSSARKKKTASGTAVLLLFSSITVTMYGITYLVMRAIGGTWERMFEWSDDEGFFDMIANLVLMFAPLAAAFFLILASFAILFRLVAETNTVEIRAVQKATLYPQQNLAAPVPVPVAVPDAEAIMQSAVYPAMAQVPFSEDSAPVTESVPEPIAQEPVSVAEVLSDVQSESPKPILPEEPVAPTVQESQGFCPACGAVVTDAMKFCNTCGTKL